LIEAEAQPHKGRIFFLFNYFLRRKMLPGLLFFAPAAKKSSKRKCHPPLYLNGAR